MSIKTGGGLTFKVILPPDSKAGMIDEVINMERTSVNAGTAINKERTSVNRESAQSWAKLR